MVVRVGLVGYGVGGQLFHAPYIHASVQCELAGVLTRSPERIAAVRRDFPRVPVFSTLAEMQRAGIDAVAISTPPHTRTELVTDAVSLGLHVVADKPFAATAEAGQQVAALAERAGVLLNVFHNRRWDTDIVTARAVIDAGELGTVSRLDLRCDQDDPGTLEAGPNGGLLRDLGSHVVDQALHLLGPASSVFALLDWRELPEGRTDVAFVLNITHLSGAHSHVSSTKLAHLSSRELRMHGRRGSYRSDYRDVQAEDIFAGRRPGAPGDRWGYETASHWGVLRTDAGFRSVPSHQGNYTRFYDEFALAVANGGLGPVPAQQGVDVLRVLDAARRSAESGCTVLVITG